MNEDIDELEDGGEERLSAADLEALAHRRAGVAPRDSAGHKRAGGTMTMRDLTVAGAMPCRRCRQPVEVSESAMAAFTGFNARLTKLGQRPTQPDQVVACDACRQAEEDKRADTNREVVEGMAAAVRVLKAGIGGVEDGPVTEQRYRAAERYLNEHDNERASSGKRESRSVLYWREQHGRKRTGRQSEW